MNTGKRITIVYSDNVDRPTIKAANIPVGEPFTGEIGGYRSVFVRTYGDMIVNLAEPNITWWGRSAYLDYLQVDDYKPVSIEIKVLG